MSTLDLVYNPVSGSFSEAHLARLVASLEARGFTVHALPTTVEGAQFSGEADLICIHGGDGTLRDTVSALGERAGEIPLCVAPSGTINLVARELGYSRKPEEFAEKVAKGWARGPDGWLNAPLYMLGELPIVSCLSIGPDSHAVARVSGPLKRRIGRYAYAVAMMQQMRDWPRSPMAIRGELTNGERFACEAEAVIVSNAALYAGPFQLSPLAALGADSVELITLTRSTRLRTLALSLAAMLKLPVGRLGIADIRTVRRVEFDRCVTPVQVDGDHMPDCAWAIGPSAIKLRYVV